MEASELTNVTIGGVSLLTLSGYLLRTFMKTWRSEKMEQALIGSDVAQIKRLNAEIIRHAKKIDDLEKNLEIINKRNIEDQFDIARINVLMEALPCGRHGCPGPPDAHKHIKELLKKIENRRNIPL